MGLFEDDFDTISTPETLLLAIRRRFLAGISNFQTSLI